MLLLAATAAVAAVHEDVERVLGAAPEPPAVPGRQTVWTRDELRRRLPLVWLAATAPDGTRALETGRPPTFEIVAPDGRTLATVEHAIDLWPYEGGWVASTKSSVRQLDSDGTVRAEFLAPCDTHGRALRAADGVRGECEGGGTWWVGFDGQTTDGTVRWTLDGGDVLELGPGTRASLQRLGPDGQRWRVEDIRWAPTPSPDGRWILTSEGVLDAATGAPTAATSQYGGWTHDGDLVHRNLPWVRIDPETGRPRPRPDGHAGYVQSVAWGPGDRIASAGSDGSVLVWDPAGGPPVHRLDSQRVVIRELRWLPSGELLFHALGDGWHVWTPGDPDVRLSRDTPLVGLDDGRFASIEDGAAVILSPEGEVLDRWVPELGAPRQVAAIDGELHVVAGGCLLAFGDEKPVALGVQRVDGAWLVDRAGPVRVLGRRPRSVPGAVSPDGRFVAMALGAGGIGIQPTEPSVSRSRAPRDLVILAAPSALPDPEALAAGLAVAHVPGDRVAWVVPGAVEPPEWLEVGRRSTARRLAAQGRVSGSTGDGRKVAESMLPQGGDEDCHQVLESPYGLLGASAYLAELARSDAFRLYPCP